MLFLFIPIFRMLFRLRSHQLRHHLYLSRSNYRLNIHLSTDCSSENVSFICSGFESNNSYKISKFKKSDLIDASKYILIPLPKEINEAILLKLPKPRSRDDADSIAFIFSNGTIVTWNVSKKDVNQLKQNLTSLQSKDSAQLTRGSLDREDMNYIITSEGKTGIYKNNIVLYRHKDKMVSYLEQYAFSHAIALSMRLAMWERLVDDFISSIGWIPDALKNGQKIPISRSDILKKTGELLSIRYQVNLTSDLVNAPDCFWDNPVLEELYIKMSAYLDVKMRGRTLSEMMNHCSAIVDVLRSHLNERHSFRLEWGIIILILFEVMFEILHYLHY